MSYAQRRNLISFIASLVVSVPYFVFTYNQFLSENPSGGDELRFWAWSIIILMVIRIIAEIIGHIMAAILVTIITQDPDQADYDLTDERDQIIELKGERNSHYVFIVGFVGSLISILTTGEVTHMFVIMIAAGFLSEMVSLGSQYFYYRKGY